MNLQWLIMTSSPGRSGTPSRRAAAWCWSATPSSYPRSARAGSSERSPNTHVLIRKQSSRRLSGRRSAGRRPCATSARATRAQALRTYDEQKKLHFAPTRGEAERLLIERWKDGAAARNPRGHLILASTNEEVDRLNQRAQEALREAGRLGFRSVRVGEERIHEGDRILFTDTDKRLGLVKSEFATVAHVDMLTRKVTVQIDGQEKPVTFSLRRFDAIRLGYAATTHRAQGMTLDQDAYVLIGGPMASRELAYVQISRARGDTHLFSDARHRSELEHILGRSDEKLSAHQIAREADRRPERQRQQQDIAPELML